MITDPIADLLTRVRNAQRAGHKSVRVRGSKMARSVLEVMKSEGFITYIEDKKDAAGKFDELEVGLKYFQSGDPVMGDIRRISKPGRRQYLPCDQLPQIHCGLGSAIVSTSQGVLSAREAMKRKIGGELLATIA